MACGRYEVYAAVHPGVWDPLLPVDVDFLLQVGFILVVDELHNGLPADKGNRNGKLELGLKKERCTYGPFQAFPMDNVILIKSRVTEMTNSSEAFS